MYLIEPLLQNNCLLKSNNSRKIILKSVYFHSIFAELFLFILFKVTNPLVVEFKLIYLLLMCYIFMFFHSSVVELTL